MNCEWVQQNIALYLYNELADDARHELEQHLQRCTDCAAELRRSRNSRPDNCRWKSLGQLPGGGAHAPAGVAGDGAAESRLVSPLRLRSHGMDAAGTFLAGTGCVMLIVGFGGGLGTMYSAMGKGTHTPAANCSGSSFHRRHHLHQAPAQFRSG